MSTGATPRKPSADMYTLLLGLALLALIIATVFAFLEADTNEYGSPPYQGAAPPAVPASMRPTRLALDLPGARLPWDDGSTSA